MPIHIFKCIVCGNNFKTRHMSDKYCSPECAIKYNKPKPRPKKKKNNFEHRAREADECGLSYGKYQAALRHGKSFEELKKEYEIKKYGRQGIFE